MGHINEFGQEVLDSTPISIPVPFTRPEPLHQRIRRMILLAQREAGEGFETEEEANDFDVPDDPNPDPSSPWEEHFMPADYQSSSVGLTDEKTTVNTGKNEASATPPASEKVESQDSSS